MMKRYKTVMCPEGMSIEEETPTWAYRIMIIA